MPKIKLWQCWKIEKNVIGKKIVKTFGCSHPIEDKCSCACHNICVLIQEIHELGIEVNYCAETNPAQKITVTV